MGTEPAEDIAAFAEVMEQIERQNGQRLNAGYMPNLDVTRSDKSECSLCDPGAL